MWEEAYALKFGASRNKISMAEEINFKIFYMTFVLSPTMQLGSVPWTEICAHNTTLARPSRDVGSGRMRVGERYPRRMNVLHF